MTSFFREQKQSFSVTINSLNEVVPETGVGTVS